MNIAVTVLTVLGLALVVGCNPNPSTVVEIPVSSLPERARALVTPEATITKVEQRNFDKGRTHYRIHYTLDGKERQIDYNDTDETRSSAVFGAPY